MCRSEGQKWNIKHIRKLRFFVLSLPYLSYYQTFSVKNNIQKTPHPLSFACNKNILNIVIYTDLQLLWSSAYIFNHLLWWKLSSCSVYLLFIFTVLRAFMAFQRFSQNCHTKMTTSWEQTKTSTFSLQEIHCMVALFTFSGFHGTNRAQTLERAFGFSLFFKFLQFLVATSVDGDMRGVQLVGICNHTTAFH